MGRIHILKADSQRLDGRDGYQEKFCCTQFIFLKQFTDTKIDPEMFDNRRNLKPFVFLRKYSNRYFYRDITKFHDQKHVTRKLISADNTEARQGAFAYRVPNTLIHKFHGECSKLERCSKTDFLVKNSYKRKVLNWLNTDPQ